MVLDPRTKSVWPTFILALLAFCLLGAAAALGVRLLGDEAKEYDANRAKERYENRVKIETEERNHLEGYAWVDQEKGTVRLPLGRAMAVALEELKAKPVAASEVPVQAPTPAVDAAVAPPPIPPENSPAEATGNAASPAAATAPAPEGEERAAPASPAENPSPAAP